MKKIIVYFTMGDAIECGRISDSRAFWRMISKHCKYMTKRYGHIYGRERVVRVDKEVLK